MKYLIASALLVVGLVQAQNKLGRVTVEELQQKVHPLDSTAPAAILFKESYAKLRPSRDGHWRIEDEVIVKIKIYRKEGYKYANFEELLYTGMLSDGLTFYDEATYNLVDGKIEKTKRRGGSEFDEKRSKYYSARKMTMPNVREGSIIEYRYVKSSVLGANLDRFFMQFDIPANYVKYTVDSPDSFVFNEIIGGYLSPEQKTSKEEMQDMNYMANKDWYVLRDVPALRDEEYVDNIDNYRANIKYEVSAFYGSVRKIFANTWDDVVKNIYENDDFGKQLDKKNYFEEDLAAVTAGVSDKTELMNKIFSFVQNHMNWNDYLGYLVENGVKAAYTERTGNVAEINLMLVAMLRHAGLQANPILVSTRSNGINIFPSRSAYNYVIAAIEIPDGLILLDATSKNAQPNVLPYRAINWSGRIIREHGSSAEVNLRPSALSKETNYVMASMDADGTLSGKIRRQYAEHNAFAFRENFGNVSQDSYLDKLEVRYPGIEVSEYQLSNAKELTKPVMENYGFTHNNAVERIGDKLYFNPLLFFTLTETPFKQTGRKYPIDFVFPNQDKYNFTVNLPEGYAIESMPKSITYTMDGNVGVFKFNCLANGNQVQVSASYEMNAAMLGAEYYQSLQDFYKEMITKQNEKIVLKRI